MAENPFHRRLLEMLCQEQAAEYYLASNLQQALAVNDERVFLFALSDVVEAQQHAAGAQSTLFVLDGIEELPFFKRGTGPALIREV